ncbi:MAG: hypothetical protein WCF57_16145 [Pyrinomonadaceae bacterium]
MQQKLVSRLAYGCVMGVLLLVASLGVAAQSKEDEGESKEHVALKNRRATPKGTDIDRTVTLDGLLSKKEADSWSIAKAAVVDGYVIQVEREEDGDQHIALATNAGETDTAKWVIVEVTPAWSKRVASVSKGQLKNLHGKQIRVTGWLYYEPDNPSTDPRGTRWEIHPVTSITILK